MSILTAVIGSMGAGVAATGFAAPWSAATVIGTACAGGYYAGRIIDAGVTYALIVSPKASGQNGNATLAYKTTSDAAPAAARTLTNGLAASTAMNSAAYPAAQYCRSLSINTYSDWYLPARDELEVLYRNLKPTTGANHVAAAWRTNATFGTTGGYGMDGGAEGYNANSSPVGAAYTSSAPLRTTVTAFQSTGTEPFVALSYWSSTECTATDAWSQDFTNGPQYLDNKTSAYYVRAVRRVAV